MAYTKSKHQRVRDMFDVLLYLSICRYSISCRLARKSLTQLTSALKTLYLIELHMCLSGHVNCMRKLLILINSDI